MNILRYILIYNRRVYVIRVKRVTCMARQTDTIKCFKMHWLGGVYTEDIRNSNKKTNCFSSAEKRFDIINNKYYEFKIIIWKFDWT